MEVIILGNGAWGSAVASLFTQNGHKIKFWENGKILDNSIVFSAIPTQAIREVLEQAEFPKNIIFINGSKGIEKGTHLLPYQIVSELLKNVNYLTLIGPSFAEEVINKMPTLVNLGFRNEETAKEVKTLLQTDYFRVRLTKSIRALELSAAFKNIYAIACGMAEGLNYGVNTRVKLMLLAMEELSALRENLGFKIDEKALPATIGDLVLTCSSEESRNFKFGEFLVKNSPKKSLELVGETVEGYFTAQSAPYFEEISGLDLRLAHFVYEIVSTETPTDIKAKFIDFVKNA